MTETFSIATILLSQIACQPGRGGWQVVGNESFAVFSGIVIDGRESIVVDELNQGD
jgi:hypothetical protein